MSAFNIFRSAKPTLRCEASAILPMDPREQRILDELRRRRADRARAKPISTSLKGSVRD